MPSNCQIFCMPSSAYCIARAEPPVALAAAIVFRISASVLGWSAADTAHEKPLSSIASFLLAKDTWSSTARTSGARLASALPASNHSSNCKRRFTSACFSLPGSLVISSVRSRSLNGSSPATVTAYSALPCAPKDITPGLGASPRTM